MKSIALLALALILSSCGQVMPYFYRKFSNNGNEQAQNTGQQKKPESQSESTSSSAKTHSMASLWEQVKVESDQYVTVKAPHNQIYHFAFNKSHLKKDYYKSLKAQANFLLRHPDARVKLEGHTDERGSREYNIALGMRRAKAVARYLKQHGVSPDQISMVSYGQEKPAALGHNEQAYWKNRRVHLKYKKL